MGGKNSTQSLYDNRLFNQDSGINGGFAVDDEYNLYDRPLFNHKRNKMYRPRNLDEDIYGMEQGKDILNKGKKEENGGTKMKRFEFEKYESSEDSEEEQPQKEKGIVFGEREKERIRG